MKRRNMARSHEAPNLTHAFPPHPDIIRLAEAIARMLARADHARELAGEK